MQEIMMLFRHVPDPSQQPTQAEIEASIKQWQDWIGGIAAQGKFVSTNQLSYEGKSLTADGLISDGPYAELKEVIGGYIIVKVENWDEATEMAKGCPILAYGGKVEMRSIVAINI